MLFEHDHRLGGLYPQTSLLIYVPQVMIKYAACTPCSVIAVERTFSSAKYLDIGKAKSFTKSEPERRKSNIYRS
jgi:hypothetical protein